GGDLGRKLVALAGAMLFPTLAFVWFPVAVEESAEAGNDLDESEMGLAQAGPLPQFWGRGEVEPVDHELPSPEGGGGAGGGCRAEPSPPPSIPSLTPRGQLG